MQVLLSRAVEINELYYLLFALLLDAQRIKELPENAELDLNSICKYVFDKSFDSEQSLFCKMNTDISLDITVILLCMIRTLMNLDSTTGPKTKDHAIILLQIFRFMYHNCDEFRTNASNPDFLSALILTVYPYQELTPAEIIEPTPIEIKLFAEAICAESTNTSYKSYLSLHPARKLVMDFLRDLLNDNILSSSKSGQIIDLVLLALPDTHLKRNQEFVTELFKTITDYLLSSDLLNEQTYSSQVNSGNVSVILQNFFNLIDRMVDKLWDGTYRREPKEVFDLIVRFISNIKKKCYSISNEQLINSMNRTLLYQLSRPTDTLTSQINLLEVLHKITSLKSLIFSQTNFQAEFFACVTHCLLMITADEEPSEGGPLLAKTQWYVTNLEQYHDEKENNAKSLLNTAAQRVWLDLYLNKKSILEECLKVNSNFEFFCSFKFLKHEKI